MSDYYPKCAPDVNCPTCNPRPTRMSESSFAAPTGLAACVAQWRDIQKRKRDFSLEAKHRGQDIAANIAMQVSNAYGYCADRLEHEMAANDELCNRAVENQKP